MTEEVRRADRQVMIDRQARRAVDFFAFILRSDGSRARARIADLSYDGCEIDGVSLDIGEIVKLELAGLGRVEAEMRWVDGDKGGARFVDQ